MSKVKELERKVDLLIELVTFEGGTQHRESILSELLNLKSQTGIRDSKSVEREVENILTELGIPSHLLGYKYLTSAVCLLIENPEYGESVCKELYPRVAKIHSLEQSRSNRVERAIRNSIEVSFDRIDCDTISKYFGNSVSQYKGRPTNTEFIFRIAQLVKREIEG